MSSLYWLLSHEALQQRVVRSIREARTPLTAWPTARDAKVERPKALAVEGKTAVIKVHGVLTQTPDFMAEMYGEPNTTYPDLIAALGAAVLDPTVKEIVWEIDSPGGSVDGLFTLLDAIEDARVMLAPSGRKMRAVGINAHSAAYGIAAAVGEIHASSRTSGFGSVGVATSGFVSGGMCGTVVDITSTDAPDKRPNLSTPEGQAVVRAELDQIATEFMGSIARGRGISPDAVAAGYGRGASMLARAAKAAGMIDHVADSRGYQPAEETPNKPADSALTTGRTSGSVPNCMATEQAFPANTTNVTVTPEPAPIALPVAVDIPVTVDTSALSDADRAELAAFRADKLKAEASERRSLITQLVALGAETPATAFADGAPVARLAAEPLAELRTRVAALSAGKSDATPKPPVTGAGTGEEQLTDFERRDAAKIEDPAARARFVAGRLARKQK
jgi:ClpP class serine protease